MSIESDQLLAGMKRELTVTESQLERYPLTTAFVNLMKHLFSFPLPLTLGAGSREPGLSPYLGYLIDDVLLKTHLRPYRKTVKPFKIKLKLA